MIDWQPVSTAPRVDGNEFLTYSPGRSGQGIYDTAGWQEEYGDFWKGGCGWEDVTHWAPLNAPTD